MDPQRQQTLWAIALENYEAAVFTAQHGWHNVRVVCRSYGLSRAIHIALGHQPEGR